MHHKLREIDLQSKTAVCIICGPVKVQVEKHYGSPRARCSVKAGERKRRMRERRNAKYGVPKDKKCYDCGLEHENYAFFDVHHLDGNHSNNSAQNLLTVCPNCHRVRHLGLLAAPQIPAGTV